MQKLFLITDKLFNLNFWAAIGFSISLVECILFFIYGFDIQVFIILDIYSFAFSIMSLMTLKSNKKLSGKLQYRYLTLIMLYIPISATFVISSTLLTFSKNELSCLFHPTVDYPIETYFLIKAGMTTLVLLLLPLYLNDIKIYWNNIYKLQCRLLKIKSYKNYRTQDYDI